MKKFAVIAAVAASAAFATVPAAAEEVRVEIAYGDLDIATPIGADKLADRIAQSVEAACAVRDSRILSAAAAADACRDEMLASAVAKLNGKGAALAAGSLSAKG